MALIQSRMIHGIHVPILLYCIDGRIVGEDEHG